MSDSHAAATFLAPEPADLAPLFPGYEIQSLIATGGMGAVYCAVQKSLDRTVALKILPLEFSNDAAFCAGFEAEAKAMARLNHPNLIGVFDFGEVNGMLYIIMEYVPGQSVYHSADGQAIDPAEVIRLVTGICEGLAHAHENGIIHRDIKPSNILLDLNAQPKIGDFGLARPVERKVEEGEEIFGTPHYTAPEVVNSPHSVDYRADIFSVGVLLHELLTGKLPADDPRPASTIVRCDTRFDAIIRRATQVLPAARYSSAKEIARDLQAIAATQTARPATAMPPRRAKPTRRPVVKKKESSSVPSLVFFLVAAAVAFAAFTYLKKPVAKTVAPTVAVPPPAATTPTKIEKPEAKPLPTPVATAEPVAAPEPAPKEDPVDVAPAEPKYDVTGFFARGRKSLQNTAKPAIANHQSGLKTNFSSFETYLDRQMAKFKPGAGPEAETLKAAIEEWKADGGKIPQDIDSALSEFPEIERIHQEYYQKQVGIEDTFKQALSLLSSRYVSGLQKQIEQLKADNDPGAVDLLEKEVTATQDDPEYFSGLMLGATVGNGN